MKVSTSFLKLDPNGGEWTAFYIPVGGRILGIIYSGDPEELSTYHVEHEADPTQDMQGYYLYDKYLIRGTETEIQRAGAYAMLAEGSNHVFWLWKIGTVPVKFEHVGSSITYFVEPETNWYQDQRP